MGEDINLEKQRQAIRERIKSVLKGAFLEPRSVYAGAIEMVNHIPSIQKRYEDYGQVMIRGKYYREQLESIIRALPTLPEKEREAGYPLVEDEDFQRLFQGADQLATDRHYVMNTQEFEDYPHSIYKCNPCG